MGTTVLGYKFFIFSCDQAEEEKRGHFPRRLDSLVV
jgi:hypothetical protein